MFNTKYFKLWLGASIPRFLCLSVCWSVFNTRLFNLFVYLCSTRDVFKFRLRASITRIVCMSVCLSMFNTKCFKLRQGAFIARFVCLSVFNTKFVTLFIYLSSTRDGVKLRLGASITRFVCLSVCVQHELF